MPSNISSNTTLPDLFTDEAYPDYYANRSVQISAGLTLEPGVVIECASDISMFVSGSNAYLNASGSASKNIIFRGSEKIKGWWKNINFSSVNILNKLDHVQVLHAGSSASNGFKSAVYIKSSSSYRAAITNTEISMTDGYGLFVDGNNNGLIEFSGNRFSDNTEAPMIVGAENLYALDNASQFTGNGIQAIVVKAPGNTNARFESSGSIKALSVDYHFMSSAELQTNLTFEPGVTCLFNSGTRLWVTATGAITANGTPSEKITFSGIFSSPGAWNGIELASASPENSIDYAIISFGGNSSGRDANIYMFNSSKLTLTNSTISDSQTWGIFLAAGSPELTESSNTFSNNASGDIGGI
ncbi:MAG: right-handed parallel beta-helix repeat-containing protein [Lentimicrobium sp.]|uniref:right-handed parallel beta-helix repeat-containing protein n=1 Tax=Lentimicrobium sp. TaxID=2034841 RepID=UPI0025E8F731|nr:right-handed parallel beta-helix repeat-containing protein [Lentimicrobium sp.]MCO5257746.1 right-handed parallel beta-helix repeat-containing protein [Lentimicrobium sp.]